MALPQFLINRPIAHRGLHNEQYPENSLSAFKNAIDHDYPIELDVQITRDGELIILHDTNLQRMTGHDVRVKDLTLADIRKYNLLNTNEKIPTLIEVLDLVAGRVPLLIEIKNTGRAGRLERKIWDMLKDYEGEYAVQSFNVLSIAWFKKHVPNVSIGQLSSYLRGERLNLFKKYFIKTLMGNKITRPDFINYNFEDLPNKYVDRYIKRRSVPLLAWTICSQADYDSIKDIVDNILFENFIPR